MAYCITWPCRRLVIYLQRREFRGPSLCLYANVFHVKHFLYNDTKLSVRRCITAGRELFAMSFKRAVAGIGETPQADTAISISPGCTSGTATSLTTTWRGPVRTAASSYEIHHHALSFIVQYINWRNVLTFGQLTISLKLALKSILPFKKI